MTWFAPQHRRDPAQPTAWAAPAPGPLPAPVTEAPAPPAPTFTPAARTATGPQPAAGHPEPVPLDGPLAVFAAVAAAGYRVPSPYWCASCGAEFTDDTAARLDRMLLALHVAARAAGWGRDPDGSPRCPACRSPRNLPEVYGGPAGDVEVMIRARIGSHAYEDLSRGGRRHDRRERQDRDTAALGAEWRKMLRLAGAATRREATPVD